MSTELYLYIQERSGNGALNTIDDLAANRGLYEFLGKIPDYGAENGDVIRIPGVSSELKIVDGPTLGNCRKRSFAVVEQTGNMLTLFDF